MAILLDGTKYCRMSGKGRENTGSIQTYRLSSHDKFTAALTGRRQDDVFQPTTSTSKYRGKIDTNIVKSK